MDRITGSKYHGQGVPYTSRGFDIPYRRGSMIEKEGVKIPWARGSIYK